jgi:pyruvate/2-oxoglutarate dehydrogenase complex dihydrolipoamide acyltransferase (E2) component
MPFEETTGEETITDVLLRDGMEIRVGDTVMTFSSDSGAVARPRRPAAPEPARKEEDPAVRMHDTPTVKARPADQALSADLLDQAW